MAHRIVLAVPAVLAALLVSPAALASGPEPGAGTETAEVPEAEAIAVDAAPVSPTELELNTSIDAVDLVMAEPLPVDDYEPEPYVDPYVNPYVDEPYEPEPERRTTLELDSGYIGAGIGPGVTLFDGGFHPNTRFELEFGGTVEHRYRDLAISFGVATHITPYYERKKPSFGADVTMTALLGPVYLRTGLGAIGGLPRQHLLQETTAGIGGVVGVGLNFGRAPMIRVGVDYDLRVSTKLEPIHTLFLVVRIACCRKE